MRLRRENGFSEDDAPTPEEHQLWLQEKLDPVQWR